MPKSINEEYFDALIRHQTYLMRYSTKVRNKIVELLNLTEDNLARQIQDQLGDTKGLTPKSLRRLRTLQKEIRKSRGRAWGEVEKVWVEELSQLVQQEPEFAADALKTVVPVLVDPVIPPKALFSGLLNHHPFEGKVLKEWAQQVAAKDIERIESQLKIGMLQGEDSRTLAKRVVGTAQLGGADGVTQISRNDATAITRTAVNSLANAARREFYKANAELFTHELYTATLDSRTTLTCAGLDGKQFKVGEGPIPPLHFNCRSLRVPVIDGEVLGDRPAKPVTEKQLVREFSEKEGLGNISKRDDLPRGTKGSFDEFKRQRVNELTGQVPAKTSYHTWLKSQSAAFQNDTLGKTRAILFRKGELQLDKFTDAKGNELTLKELATKHNAAFIAAGLDPTDF